MQINLVSNCGGGAGGKVGYGVMAGGTLEPSISDMAQLWVIMRSAGMLSEQVATV